MPLGFAKDILAKGASGPPPMTDRGYWKGTGTPASGANGANVIYDRGADWSWAGDSTLSYWFNGSTSDMDSQASIAHYRRFDHFPLNHTITQGASGNISAGVTGNSTKNESFSITVTNFDTLYLNSQWHHVVLSIKTNATTYVSQCYLDGVQLINRSTGGKTATTAANSSRFMYIGAGANNSPGGNYENDPDGAHKLKIANYWYDNSFIDLTTDITKFYNGGGIDLGSQGTTSGLTRPDLYLYSNAAGNMVGSTGTLQNGGDAALNLIKGVREGTGNISVSTSGGPT